MKKVLVKVLKRHAKNAADYLDNQQCLLAQALRERFGSQFACVTGSVVELRLRPGDPLTFVNLPDHADTRALEWYDEDRDGDKHLKNFRPFQFTLEIPQP